MMGAMVDYSKLLAGKVTRCPFTEECKDCEKCGFRNMCDVRFPKMRVEPVKRFEYPTEV